jgi:RNA polymerase sigma-70 factor (ECF subfamily)
LHEHRPAVLTFLRRRVWDRDTAEDLCQETFLRVLRTRPLLRDASRLRAYLLRVAYRLVLDHVRKRDPAVPVPIAAMDSLAAEPASDPAARYESKELAGRLLELLAALPRDQRIAFELGVLDRCPYTEIARRHGWSVAKVKVSIYRARRRLLDALDRDAGAERSAQV